MKQLIFLHHNEEFLCSQIREFRFVSGALRLMAGATVAAFSFDQSDTIETETEMIGAKNKERWWLDSTILEDDIELR